MGQGEVLEILKGSNKELSCVEIADMLDRNPSTISYSLRKLREQGLIEMKCYTPKDIKYKLLPFVNK